MINDDLLDLIKISYKGGGSGGGKKKLFFAITKRIYVRKLNFKLGVYSIMWVSY